MEREPGLKWLFFDLNSYFASVEQQERLHLRGKPVAVVPMKTEATCAIAASYEAKAYGVKTGTKIYEARKMCPGLRCVLARHDVYVDYHHRIISEVALHTPINKIWSIDELSSRLPPGKRSVDAARVVAQRIKEGIWRNVGEAINCSIGVAPNSLLAKMAGEVQKPNGLVIWRQEDVREALMGLRLSDVPGIGVNMEKRLHCAGIRTMEQFWDISPKQARRIWGSVQGERMWYWLHGYDFEQPETGNVMIGHSRVLDPALRPPEKARLMARRLMTKATYRLRRKGYYAGVVSLGVRTCDGQSWREEARLPSPARDPFSFLQALDGLWMLMMDYFWGIKGLRLKKVSVVLHGLKRPEEMTGDLLERGRADMLEDREKHEALASALDTLQAKYQKEAVTLGVVPKTQAGHVGTKIAFSRVPEQEEFWS